MPNINLNSSEQAIVSDLLNYIQSTATTTTLGGAIPVGASLMTLTSLPITEVVLDYGDNGKFVVQIDVRQINTNAGLIGT